MNEENINIELTKDEAIVLFEFLTRFNNQNNPDIFDDQAEQRVLWNFESLLEKKLTAPFRPDYLDIVKKARDKVRDKE